MRRSSSDGGATLAAQASAKPQQAATDKMKAADMAAKCQAMMAEHEKMMTDMKVADQRLDDLGRQDEHGVGYGQDGCDRHCRHRNGGQSRTMRDGMMKMQKDMMTHMMEHMQAGKDSMAMCPMMKHMGDMKH